MIASGVLLIKIWNELDKIFSKQKASYFPIKLNKKVYKIQWCSLMATGLADMPRETQKISLKLPKIEHDAMSIGAKNSVQGSKSPYLIKTPELSKKNVNDDSKLSYGINFPLITDDNNNTTRNPLQPLHSGFGKKTTILRPKTRADSGFCDASQTLGSTSQTKGAYLANNNQNHGHELKKERDLDISVPSIKKTFDVTKGDTNDYRGCFATGRYQTRRRMQPKQRIQQCSIIKNSEDSSLHKVGQRSQNKGEFNPSTTLETSAMSKCNAWLDSWFTADGRPKEDALERPRDLEKGITSVKLGHK